jgi:nucleotide-binding universal stress UspA family protein
VLRAFRRILLATNRTPSAAAFARAVLLARKFGAELLIAHVYRPPNISLAEAVAPGVYDEWDENLRSDAARMLQPLVEKARRQLVPAWPLVLRGVPRKAIVEAAREKHADLIVIGSSRRRGLARLLPWSFASRLASSAPCHVLAIPITPAGLHADPFLHPIA